MYRKIYDSAGVELIHLEYFHDYDVEAPTAFAHFRESMSRLHETYGKYTSYAFESVTSAALASRKYHQKVLNPDTKEPRQWHAGATDDLEEFLCMRLPALPYNVGVSLHTSREKDEVNETFVRNLSAPGRLSTRHQLAAFWPECYRAYAKEHVIEGKGAERQVYYLLQTRFGRIDGEQWIAATQIHPKQLIWNSYDQLWDGQEGARPIWHGLVYGDTGAGKTTFLASLPKPLYVWFFDGLGKETPYIRQGIDGGMKDA